MPGEGCCGLHPPVQTFQQHPELRHHAVVQQRLEDGRADGQVARPGTPLPPRSALSRPGPAPGLPTLLSSPRRLQRRALRHSLQVSSDSSKPASIRPCRQDRSRSAQVAADRPSRFGARPKARAQRRMPAQASRGARSPSHRGTPSSPSPACSARHRGLASSPGAGEAWRPQDPQASRASPDSQWLKKTILRSRRLYR